VSGTAPQGAGASISLEADAWPFRGYVAVTTTIAGAGGAYAFPPLRPDRNELLRVSVAGQGTSRSATSALTVLPRVRLGARSLGPGRTLLTLGVRHAQLGSAAAPSVVRWFTAATGSNAYHLIAVTSASELPGGLLRAETIIDPPARHFAFRVCINPPWEAAMGAAAERGRCPRTGFVLPGRGSH
jgi:hypothetical protein